MTSLNQYRLFISHAWSYSEAYLRMVQRLNSVPNFSHSNYSVPEEKAFEHMRPDQLQEQIRGQIRPVNVVIVLGGMYAAHSDWIQFEIDHARQVRKPILGVTPWGADPMPAAVTLASNEIVGWETDSIVAAIRRLA